MNRASPDTKRWLIYLAWVLVCAGLFSRPLIALFHLAMADESASHILLMPLISATLLYMERKPMERTRKRDYLAAGVFFISALGCVLLALRVGTSVFRDHLSLYLLAFLLMVVAGFIALLGWGSAKNSRFALALLLFMVPLPDAVLNRIIYALQAGSAEIAEFFFEISGVPVLREGFVFRLPRMSIEVARECSGIRSSIALLILALLVAHFSFRPLWKKLVFVAAGLLMMLVKNGIRIAALTLLANYVNPEFLTGKLHRQGGVVFFLIGLLLLVPVLRFLQRGENPPLANSHAD